MLEFRKNPVSVNEIEKAKAILEEIRDKLRAAGHLTAKFHKHDQDELIEFDIMTGLSVFDHREPQADVQCIACPVHPSLQYEFIIEDIHGHIHRPIGSVCILKRSLGDTEAERYGRRLQQAARTYFRPIRRKPNQANQVELSLHEQEHRKMRREAGNVRAYLNGLGLNWLPLAELQGDPWVALSADDRQTIRSVLSAGRHLTEAEFWWFGQLNQQRNERQLIGRPLAEDRMQPPYEIHIAKNPPHKSGAAEQERGRVIEEGQVEKQLARAIKKPKKRNFSQLQYVHNPDPLSEEEWVSYIKDVGYDYNAEDWKRVSPFISEANVKRIKNKLAQRVPLNFKDILDLRRGHDLWKRSQYEYGRPTTLIERYQPLGEEQAVGALTGMLIERMRSDGYDTEFEMFQQIEDIPSWLRKYLSAALQHVKKYEINYLPTAELLPMLETIRKKHGWATDDMSVKQP